MANEPKELVEAPDTCEETTEYDNSIDQEVEIEPDEENESLDALNNWLKMDQTFTRYERNYRARRIRELTISPLRKKRRRRSNDAAGRAAT